MWIYKLNNNRYSNGIWKIPDNCINAKISNLKKELFKDYEICHNSSPILKSAVLCWFSDINKDKKFTINMNGFNNIILQCENEEIKEIYFWNYYIIGNYLVKTNNYSEFLKLELMLKRKDKIDKLLKND